MFRRIQMYRCISFDTIVSDILYLFLYGDVKRFNISVVCVSSIFLSCQVRLCPLFVHYSLDFVREGVYNICIR